MSIRRLLSAWLPIAIVATAMCGILYVVAQQSYRMGANDVPKQVAEDAAAAAGRGAPPAGVVGSATVDLAKSLAPFVAVFNTAGELVASSARLDGATPAPPAGVLAAARVSGLNAVTWQPKAGVRMATVTVVVPSGEGFTVMAGHSLREAEAHIEQLGQLVGFGWLVALVASFAAVFVGIRLAGTAQDS
jgi:hypothetical protein